MVERSPFLRDRGQHNFAVRFQRVRSVVKRPSARSAASEGSTRRCTRLHTPVYQTRLVEASALCAIPLGALRNTSSHPMTENERLLCTLAKVEDTAAHQMRKSSSTPNLVGE